MKWLLVTLFSAPNYCDEFDNAGVMMSVRCSFQILRVRLEVVGNRVRSFRTQKKAQVMLPVKKHHINKVSLGNDVRCAVNIKCTECWSQERAQMSAFSCI